MKMAVCPLTVKNLSQQYMLKSKKSPGFNGMVGEMCKRLWSAVPDYIVCIYNKCLETCYFPNIWKKANVVILLTSVDKESLILFRTDRSVCCKTVKDTR